MVVYPELVEGRTVMHGFSIEFIPSLSRGSKNKFVTSEVSKLHASFAREYKMKKILTQVITVVLLAMMIFAISSPVAAQVQEWEESGCMVDDVPTLKCLETVYSNILYLSSAFVLIVLFVMIIYGAFIFMTSMGNASKITQGANILKWAFIGLGVFIASYVILFIVDVAFLGGKGEIFRLNIPGPGD